MKLTNNITNDHTKATIRIVGTLATVDPLVPALLPALTLRRDLFISAHGGVERVRRDVSCCYVDLRDRLHIAAGLVPRVRLMLEGLGFSVRIDDRREWGDRHQPDPAITGAFLRTEEMLQAVTQHPLGQLVMTRPSDMVPWISAICLKFPRARILIPTATKKRAWQVWQGLRQPLGEHLQLASGTWYVKARVVVSTYAHIVDPGRWDIVLLPTPADLASGRVSERVMGMFRAPLRVYALLPAGTRRSSDEQLAVENVAGPVIYSAAPPALPAYVLMAEASSPPLHEAGGLDRKRMGYWLNDRRNRFIASVAGAFEAGDVPALWKLNLLLDEAKEFLSPHNPPRVAVLVESTEHARQLCEHLPGWVVLSKSISERDRFAALTSSAAVGRVVTTSYAADHGVDAHIIVRADGGDAPLDIKGFPPLVVHADVDNVLVVDFMDDFDRLARRATRRRIDGYQRRGWPVERAGEERDETNRRGASKLPGLPAVQKAESGIQPAG